jgi:hypothetical protein
VLHESAFTSYDFIYSETRVSRDAGRGKDGYGNFIRVADIGALD